MMTIPGSKPLQARIYANRDVERVLAAIPKGHTHIRMLLECADGTRMIFQEATLAALTRAYLSILLHPDRAGIELRVRRSRGKKGYAEWQLIETPRQEQDIVTEISDAEASKAKPVT